MPCARAFFQRPFGKRRMPWPGSSRAVWPPTLAPVRASSPRACWSLACASSPSISLPRCSRFCDPSSRKPEGRVLFRGRPIENRSPHQITALGMTRTFQTSRVFKRMTVLEHLLVGGHLHQRTGVWGAIARPAWVAREEAEARARGLRILELFEDHLLPLLNE